MHIANNLRSGHLYASVVTSVRENGKVRKKLVRYLGRVLDAERGIYQSKERGVFSYDLKTDTISPAPEDFVPNVRRKNAREELLVDFGDTHLFSEFLRKIGLDDVIRSIPYGNLDSAFGLLHYYMQAKESNAHAECWFDGNYAHILYPNANLSSQRISDMLHAVGREDSLRAFFKSYLEWLGTTVTQDANILIDSTGVPNSIRFPITAVSNHNGQISEEVRLIYVVQQGTRMPIYMRYVPGNVIDTTTLATTIKELKAMGVNTKFAILDAGYVTAECIEQLCEEKISFITRCPTNRKVYKDLIAKELDGLEDAGNLAVDKEGRLFNGRQVYIKCVPVEYEGHHLYAYVCRDKGMQEVERKKFLDKNANGRINAKKFHEEMREHGVFVLLATRRIQAEHVLSHYYVRQDIEQVFDITKNYASLLPLNVEKEETFRGHLLMTFIATALLQRIQNELKNSNFSLDRILMRMRTQKAKVFENVVIPGEPVKEHRQIYKLLGVKCAKEYVRKAPTA